MGFDLLWADDPNAEREPPQYFRVLNVGMEVIRDELEAQGVGAYVSGDVRNHVIDLNKLSVNDGQWVSDAECSGIVRLASVEPVLGRDHIERELDDLDADEAVAAWVDLWPRFLDYVRSAVDHRGFYVY